MPSVRHGAELLRRLRLLVHAGLHGGVLRLQCELPLWHLLDRCADHKSKLTKYSALCLTVGDAFDKSIDFSVFVANYRAESQREDMQR